jgi:hypothetical protein
MEGFSPPPIPHQKHVYRKLCLGKETLLWQCALRTLLCLMPDDFTCQGESSATESVN